MDWLCDRFVTVPDPLGDADSELLFTTNVETVGVKLAVKGELPVNMSLSGFKLKSVKDVGILLKLDALGDALLPVKRWSGCRSTKSMAETDGSGDLDTHETGMCNDEGRSKSIVSSNEGTGGLEPG